VNLLHGSGVFKAFAVDYDGGQGRSAEWVGNGFLSGNDDVATVVHKRLISDRSNQNSLLDVMGVLKRS
jgi:hypothetical protein